MHLFFSASLRIVVMAILFFTAGIAHSQDSSSTFYQYAILEMTQSSAGRTSFNIDFPSKKNDNELKIHYTDQGALRVTTETGQFQILNEEAAILNFLAQKGWRVVGVYQITILSKSVIRYVLEKKIKNQ